VAVVSTYISQDVGWSSTNTLREDLLKHCVELDMSFHKSRQPGELIERLDGDVTALFGFFSKLMLNLINNGALLLGILVMLFLEDWRVGAALSFFAVTAVFVLWKIQPLAVKHWAREREMNAKFFGFIGEQVSSLEDIRSSGAVQNSMRQFYEFLRKWYPIRKKANMMGSMMWITTMGLFAFGNMVALKSCTSWVTYAMLCLKSLVSIESNSLPLIRILPSVGSYNLTISLASVVFPLPVLPKTPSTLPGSSFIERS
jgi:ABC-type multidrug transport system fused ATPase/permease subunit